jgi:hypothetical protein
MSAKIIKTMNKRPFYLLLRTGGPAAIRQVNPGIGSDFEQYST